MIIDDWVSALSGKLIGTHNACISSQENSSQGRVRRNPSINKEESEEENQNHYALSYTCKDVNQEDTKYDMCKELWYIKHSKEARKAKKRITMTDLQFLRLQTLWQRSPS